jgi:manganese transport protein
VLSLALPLPMITLIWFTRRTDIMGKFANSRVSSAAAILGTAVVLSLNVILVLDTIGISILELSTSG